jgi:hypothetical protein
MSQRIFINDFPEYTALPACAEHPLSTIVRDMVNGCGDNGKTTSYNCFCTESSSHFTSVISTEVGSSCLPQTTTAVEQAVRVFDLYCAKGADSAVTTNGTSIIVISFNLPTQNTLDVPPRNSCTNDCTLNSLFRWLDNNHDASCRSIRRRRRIHQSRNNVSAPDRNGVRL